MKRIAISLILVIAAAGVVVAQAREPEPRVDETSVPVPTRITVEGKIVLVQGLPAVVSGGMTYLVHSPITVSGLVAGANVKLEGYRMPLVTAANTAILRPESITIDGKVMDLDRGFGAGRMQRNDVDRPGMAGAMRAAGNGRMGGGMLGGPGSGRRR